MFSFALLKIVLSNNHGNVFYLYNVNNKDD